MLKKILPVLLICGLTACGGQEAAEEYDQAPTEAIPEAPTPAPAPPTTSVAAQAPFVLTVADLDLCQKGRTEEIALYEKAAQAYKATSDEEEQLEILGRVMPPQPRDEAAASIGLTPERYKQITEAIDDVLGKQEMKTAMAAQMADVDTTAMDAEMRAHVRKSQATMDAAWGNPYQGLAPDVAAALQARYDELAQLRGRLMAAQFTLGR